MISFKNVTKVYCPKFGKEYIAALDNVCLNIEEKEFVSVVGKSGAGKSTLFKLLLAEEKPDKGDIIFDGFDLLKLKKRHIPKLRKRIGAVFQDYKLFPAKTTYENVAYIMEAMGAVDEEIKRDVPQVLEVVGLSDKACNFPVELSGGEKQRVAIARALVHRPEIILADEPTGNLDPYNTLEIIRLLVKIYEFGTTIILATHNKNVINFLGKRVITLDKGKIIRDEKRGKFII